MPTDGAQLGVGSASKALYLQYACACCYKKKFPTKMCSNMCMFIIFTYLHYGERKNGDISTPKFGGDLLYGAMIHQDEWELHHRSFTGGITVKL